MSLEKISCSMAKRQHLPPWLPCQDKLITFQTFHQKMVKTCRFPAKQDPTAPHLKVLRCWIGLVVHACDHSAHQVLIEGFPTIFSTVPYRMPYNTLIPRMIVNMLSCGISTVVTVIMHIFDIQNAGFQVS